MIPQKASVVGDDRSFTTEDSRAKTLRKMVSSKKRSERFLCQFAITLKELFPKWDEWLNRIPEPRQEAKCSYSLPTLLWLSLVLMMSGQESRNQYNENLLTEETQAILENMFGLE